MTARGGGEPRSTDGGGGAAKDSGRAVDGVPPSNEEPHVGGAPRDEGDDHARVSSAAWTSPVEDRSVVRGRPARRGGGGGGGGGDRARDASSRDRAAKGDHGSRSPRRSSRGGVSPSPPPSVTRRDVYALETLSVGLPAGLANPTASCVHTSGPAPDEEHERTSKDLSEYHLAKHQRSRLHHHADHHATHVQHHHHQQDPGGDASPATPGDESTQLATTQPLMHSPKMPQPPITPEAAAEAARLVRVAEMLQTGGRAEEALAAIDTALTLAPGNLDAVTKRGLCFQALGALHDAYNAYDCVIRREPNHALACRALGSLFQTYGMLAEAADAFRRSLRTNPGDAPTRERLAATLTDLGTRVKVLGAPAQAVAHYREAAATDPRYSPAFYNLGVVMSELGRHDEALECYARAIEVNPAHAEAHCNVGVIKKYRGDVTGAIEAYERCLAVNPNHALGRGNLSIALGDRATAIKASGDVALAVRTYERALTLDPNSAEAMYNLGVAQAEIGELDRATIAYESTLRLRPHCAEAWNNLGVLHRERNNVERAVECYRRAVAINPSFAQPLNNLGVVYTMQGQARMALEALQRAVAAAPTYAVAHNNLGVLLRDTGDVPEALEAYGECARHSPDHRNAEQNYLLGLNYVLSGERREVCEAHASWGARFAAATRRTDGEPPLAPRRLRDDDWGAGEGGTGEAKFGGEVGGGGTRAVSTPSARSFGLAAVDSDDDDSESNPRVRGSNPSSEDETDDVGAANARSPKSSKSSKSEGANKRGRRLVVGYVSPDMYTHSVSYFAHAPLSAHDPSRVRVIVYSATPRADAMTQTLKQRVAAIDGTWRDVQHLTERQLAEAIRADGVDILVELTGHTANNRLGAMALRPAPVQVTWIGYPNSTGLAEIDYRITDAVCDPHDTTQTFTETLVRLPGCFLSYTPSVEAPAVAPAPCLTSGYVTFGCFNTLAKVTPDVRSRWARIMREVPNSRLLLKAKPFACQTIQQRFLAAMAAEGVESWRVDLFPLTGGTGAHLSVYGTVDIALDTFPYAGTTTTCESLWMGVPVLTARGKCHAQNVGASLLSAVGGLEEFVATDEDDYVRRAVRLAGDHARLAAVRSGLRARMASSGGLCDARSFMRGVEERYAEMWRRWCEREVERESGRVEEGVRDDAWKGGRNGKKKGSGSECSTDDQRSPSASR